MKCATSYMVTPAPVHDALWAFAFTLWLRTLALQTDYGTLHALSAALSTTAAFWWIACIYRYRNHPATKPGRRNRPK